MARFYTVPVNRPGLPSLFPAILTLCLGGCEVADQPAPVSVEEPDTSTFPSLLSVSQINKALADFRQKEEEWADLYREFADQPDNFRGNRKLWDQWVELSAVLGKSTEQVTFTPEPAETKDVDEKPDVVSTDRRILEAKLDRAKKLLKNEETRFRGLDVLSTLILSKDLPIDIRIESDELFDRQKDETAQRWLLKQCEAHVGQLAFQYPDWEPVTAMEMWCLWHACTAIGDHRRAEFWLNEAMTFANQSESSRTAANAGASLAGALFFLQRNKEAMRAIEISATGLEAGDYRNSYIYCCLGAICYRMGDLEQAEHFKLRARSGQRWTEYTDAMYFALCGRLKDARIRVDRIAWQKSLAVLSLSAAAAGQLDESTSAKRQVLQSIGQDSRNYSSVRAILVWADAIAGRFEMAEQRASRMPKGYSRSFAYTAIADEYIVRGDSAKANEAMRQVEMAFNTTEVGFYLARLRIRQQPSMSNMYRWACLTESESYRLTLICGLVAGLHPDLPARSIRHINGK